MLSRADAPPRARAVHGAMRALAARCARILLGDAALAALAAERKALDGRLSVRAYRCARGPPRGAEGGLGAHVDGNLFTLLWASAEGLQVLALRPADRRAVCADDVLSLGAPTVGAARPCAPCLLYTSPSLRD